MKILVANLGSTSFKYKIFDMPSARILGQGGMDRIGSSEGSFILSLLATPVLLIKIVICQIMRVL